MNAILAQLQSLLQSAPSALAAATLLPLLSFVAVIFLGKKIGKPAVFFSLAIILTSHVLSVYTLIRWVDKPEFNQPHYVEALTYTWIPLPDQPPVAPAVAKEAAVDAAKPVEAAALPAIAKTRGLEIGILVDSLTIAMFVMITLVATLVQFFSIAYMDGDARYTRFFAYVSLFCFSMLGLVLSNSLLQLFVFWELVGACSYLLIGFWFENRGPAQASKKAMVVNRVGDAAFLAGIGLLLYHVGVGGLTLFDAAGNSTLAQHVLASLGGNSAESVLRAATPGGTYLGLHWLTWSGILLFGGAMAKSAQFPLHVWLPDAMEGPTPVSALIHAATMVAAGVYLVARIYPILTLDARLFIATIGCITLAMAALMAIVATDVKKVLAYSTISQLGFMMLFLGAGGYVAGLFHLMTHAFFKACLFLGAGSVIYGCHHEQDMRRMGGLWKKMPVTALTFLLSVFAIAGTPQFSGFFSKDLGLAVTYEYAHALGGAGMLLYWVPTITAYITAFYMGRCWWLTFGGKPRDQHVHEHAHESSIMNVPLLVLGVLAVIAGQPFIGIDKIIAKSIPLFTNVAPNPEHGMHVVHQTVGWAWLIGPVVALAIYYPGLARAERIRRVPGINLVYHWLANKMYFDELYNGVLVNLCKVIAWIASSLDKLGIDGLVNLSATLTRGLGKLSGMLDLEVVDGAVNGVAALAHEGGRSVLAPQTGRIRFYVLSMLTLVGMVVVGVAVAMLVRH